MHDEAFPDPSDSIYVDLCDGCPFCDASWLDWFAYIGKPAALFSRGLFCFWGERPQPELLHPEGLRWN